MTSISKVIFLLWCSLLAVASQSLSVSAQEASRASRTGARTKILSETTERVVLDSSFLSGRSTASPNWDHGYMVSREIETYTPTEANVRLYDKTGQMVRESSIWFPGAVRILLTSAAVSSDGRILASGTADKADGTSAPFLALTDPTGAVTSVIQTGGFYPTKACLAPDGTAWSFGGSGYYGLTTQPKPGETFRHFDFQKGQIGAYIPRSEYPDVPAPGVLAFIRCTDKAVAIYSSMTPEYIELEYGSSAAHRYRAEVPANLSVTGFAFIGSKRAFGYLENLRSSGDNAQGLYSLEFDEAARTARWLPVEGAIGSRQKPGVITALWGADGERLVLNRGGDSAGQAGIHLATLLKE